ncbi:23S rRNA (guanosine(2251)-2'-O)-methyltransferase RlmB [Lutibacter sp. TH_r2]|uniref:23S rRNA (guanosine(2251)-2'-O)-methyltransferase RlmB n=1 Tax=Lutibacter sp. TH_r2 TaxID=3082083 RepID=UPI002955C4F1|nr:23S rRNA (guanosine(2251)-2'-O)-methyltransferase RlmB [Lutibacter sp. TH_r2]MDV7185768.1 23S rRNA (guanosine(2251)-2'-O)-methyltransferase RlmB [Lutibacter sp. TH_r2]
MEQQSKIFGIRAVIEAINSGKTISKVFLQKSLSGQLFSELNTLLAKHNISKSYVPVEKLNRLSKNNNHQGVVAEISPIEFADLDTLISESLTSDTSPLFLILDGISDVRNFGAIIRTAECTGVNAIVISKQGSAPVNSETIKTSAGAAFKVPICKVDHIKDALFQFGAADIQTVAATEKTENSVYNINFTKPIAIIMGSEDRGVNPSVLKMVNEKAKLPLLGEIESLNVSVACGAFLYEATRQRL